MSEKLDVFTPEQLKETVEFVGDQDLVTILTEKNKTYTKNYIRSQIKKFKEREED